MRGSIRILGGAVMVAVLGGCATSAADCDPSRVRNVLDAGSCTAFGGFEANLAQARSDLEARRQELLVQEQSAAAAQARQARLSTDLDARRRDLENQQQDLDRLQLTLTGVETHNDRDRARVTAMQEQLRLARAELARLNDPALTPQAIAEEEARLNARRAALDEALRLQTERVLQE
ncbi:hypothetical protein [Niveispirillum fermenti]|uniref:hypothetical protein n=1 Tax=Niveispirillum fermenti TaxID=1233113 RepID=UPI003A8B8E7F